jgi:Secretion system C-terminal sorting domain
MNVPANGATWRMEVEQTSNHPYQLVTSTAIEGCGVNSEGTVSRGFINQFPLNDESPNQDEFCIENTEAYNPNNKTGYPTGITDANFISQDQQIQYGIRFQNLGGNDTVEQVIILDTLSNLLDITTFQFLGSNLDCEVFFLSGNILQFVFSNLTLIPSNNLFSYPSVGYVSFLISPIANISEGAEILNTAYTYFDNRKPIITNTTLHTIEATTGIFTPASIENEVEISVLPNPNNGFSTLLLNGNQPGMYRIAMFNVLGSMVHEQEFEGMGCELQLGAMPAGNYQLNIMQNNKWVGTTRLVIVKE